MTVDEKRNQVNNYCHATSCRECVLRGENWTHKYECSTGGNCLAIFKTDETELNKALELIGSHRDDKKTKTPNQIREANGLDPVNCPAHYTDGKIEVIDYIEDKKLGFCLGNAIKYISRAGKKDPTKEVEDLNKAIWYIKRRIKEIEEGIA